jgi:hypothetical protein
MKRTPFKPRTTAMKRSSVTRKPVKACRATHTDYDGHVFKVSRPKARSAEINAHWDRVRALGCIVTGKPNPTLHHVHGGSMRGIAVSGMGMKASDWLVIPLDISYHSLGPRAIDGSMGVAEWERLYGRQLDHLKNVCRLLKVDVFAKAGITLDE